MDFADRFLDDMKSQVKYLENLEHEMPKNNTKAFTINRGDSSNSGLFTAIVIIVVYCFSTFLAFKDGNLFAKVSSIGGMIGVLIPGAILILLGFQGEPISESYLQSSYIPKITGISSPIL